MVVVTTEKERILKDIQKIENSNMFVNEKKYYLNLIDILSKNDYYKNRETIKDIWSK